MSEAILVTGASSDIGRALIKRLPAGATVLAHYHRGRAALLDASAARRDLEVIPLECDFTNAAATADLAASVVSQKWPVRSFVHLAAPRLALQRFREVDWDGVGRSVDVQVRAAGTLLQAVLPAIVESRRGRVVFVLSSIVTSPTPAYMTEYAVAKFAMLGLMRSVVAEYTGRGVCVNAVSPAMTDTQFLTNVPAKVVELAAAKNPRKRNAKPDEVAAVIEFLLSDDAEFVSGANVPVTGGEAL